MFAHPPPHPRHGLWPTSLPTFNFSSSRLEMPSKNYTLHSQLLQSIPIRSLLVRLVTSSRNRVTVTLRSTGASLSDTLWLIASNGSLSFTDHFGFVQVSVSKQEYLTANFSFFAMSLRILTNMQVTGTRQHGNQTPGELHALCVCRNNNKHRFTFS